MRILVVLQPKQMSANKGKDMTGMQSYESPQCLMRQLHPEGVLASSINGSRSGYGNWVNDEWES